MATILNDQWLTNKYKLSDLTKTSQPFPNIPNTAQIENLRSLAYMLEKIDSKVGPFQIASAYRSYLVNQAVDGAEGSLHTSGMAADLVPYSMDAETFWTRIYVDPSLRENLGEIILKPSQGSIHISLPTATKHAVPMILDHGSYRMLSSAEISNLTSKIGAVVQAGLNPMTLGISLLVLSVSAFLFAKLRTRKQQS